MLQSITEKSFKLKRFLGPWFYTKKSYIFFTRSPLGNRQPMKEPSELMRVLFVRGN